MKLALLSALVLTGCGSLSSNPVLYDGRRHVVVYCDQAREHIRYLEAEIANSRNADFIRETTTMLWNIRFSCPANS
jgi:hypothetical protein